MRVLGVLPLWLDTILEQIVRGHRLQLAGRLDVVVETAPAESSTRRQHMCAAVGGLLRVDPAQLPVR